MDADTGAVSGHIRSQYYRIYPSSDGGDDWGASFDELGKVKITVVNQAWSVAQVVDGDIGGMSEGCSVVKVPPDEEKKLLEKEQVKQNDAKTRRFGY